ncbi:MAG TPA: hypothetical protein VNV41_00335 [Candidatus Acidoferrales bacterium]|jgi:hypothetical protein|nr:hypothetical protein [Candidatus Acidoferrales bacterium]
MGTCPKCEKHVGHVNIAEVSVGQIFGQQWRGIKYCCASCGCVLSVAVDPIAIKSDIVAEVLRGLGRG